MDDGRGRRSLKLAISELIRSRLSLEAPLVDLVASKLRNDMDCNEREWLDDVVRV